MATMNTHRTLNDYRLSREPLDTGAHAKSHAGAGALVFAIFLGVGAYFFYTAHQGENVTAPASEAALPGASGAEQQPAPQSDAMMDAPGNATVESNAAAPAADPAP